MAVVSVSDAKVWPLMLDWAAASWVTEKVTEPLSAPEAAVAMTDVDEEVAVAAPQVVACWSFSAAACRPEKRVLTDCSALSADCSVVREDLRRFCGTASTCISWLMMPVVSRPLISPSTVVATSPPSLPGR